MQKYLVDSYHARSGFKQASFYTKINLISFVLADVSTLSARFFRVLADPYAYGVFNITQYSRFMMTINNKTYEKIRSSR